MKPEYRYFKCDLEIEPIKSLDKQWRNERKKRNEQLNAIFDTIPFFDGWKGSESQIWGIICKVSNPEFDKIKSDNTYKIEKFDNERVSITGNKRTKAGKAFNAQIQGIRDILQKYPCFNDFMLRKLKLNCWVLGDRTAYVAVCGIASGCFILSIPVKTEGYGGDEFPTIPEYLTEIKQSEFLALQGK